MNLIYLSLYFSFVSQFLLIEIHIVFHIIAKTCHNYLFIDIQMPTNISSQNSSHYFSLIITLTFLSFLHYLNNTLKPFHIKFSIIAWIILILHQCCTNLPQFRDILPFTKNLLQTLFLIGLLIIRFY